MSGKTQAQTSAKGAEKVPNYAAIYKYKLPSVDLSSLDFRLTLLGGSRPFDLGEVTESIDWEDDDGYTATIVVRRPDPGDAFSLPIQVGMQVKFEIHWSESWYELWRLRCAPPQSTVEDGSVTVDLADEFDALNRNRRDWLFRKTKRRKRGYYAHEIAAEVAAKCGVAVGSLAKGKHRIDKLVKRNSGGLQVIKDAYAEEQKSTGINYVIRMRDGKLEVVPLVRPPLLYTLGEQITGAQFSSSTDKAQPVTVLEGHGRIGSGKKAKKITWTEKNQAVINQLGYLKDEKNYGRVRSLTDLKARVKRDYAKGIKIKQQASLSHPLIPFLRVGDAVAVEMPSEGWTEDTSFAWVTRASFSVSSDDHTMDLDVDQEDPWIKKLAAQEKDVRAAKRKDRKKKSSG